MGIFGGLVKFAAASAVVSLTSEAEREAELRDGFFSRKLVVEQGGRWRKQYYEVNSKDGIGCYSLYGSFNRPAYVGISGNAGKRLARVGIEHRDKEWRFGLSVQEAVYVVEVGEGWHREKAGYVSVDCSTITKPVFNIEFNGWSVRANSHWEFNVYDTAGTFVGRIRKTSSATYSEKFAVCYENPDHELPMVIVLAMLLLDSEGEK